MCPDDNSKHYLECIEIINNFMQTDNDSLAVDSNGTILKEYADNVGDSKAYQLLLIQLQNEGRVHQCSDHLPAKIVRRLDELKFHEAEDRVFLGVAYNGDKYLITNDSDYNVGDKPGNDMAYKYFCEELGMKILGPKDGAEDTRKRFKEN